MKEYLINFYYKGRYFDFRLCSRSYSEAAEKIGCNAYHFRKYGICRKINNPYVEIFLKPYSHNTRHLFDYSKEYELEYVKTIIDKECKKNMRPITNKHNQ